MSEELLLGGGDLLFQDRRSAGFDGPDGERPYLLQTLPPEYFDVSALVRLAHSKTGEWQVHVTVSLDLPAAEDEPAILGDIKVRRRFSEDLAQLRKFDGSGELRKQHPGRKDIVELLYRLAADLRLPDEQIPTLRDSPTPSDREQYKRAIGEKILRPAKAIEKQLAAYDWLQQHAEKIETVIYRQVETDLYARYLVYGNPDGAEPPEASQNGFSNGDE